MCNFHAQSETESVTLKGEFEVLAHKYIQTGVFRSPKYMSNSQKVKTKV